MPEIPKIAVPATPRLIISIFIAALFVPGLFGLLGFDVLPGFTENRTLAKFPSGEFRNLDFRSFSNKLDAFANDHFGFRPILIHTIGRLKLALHASSSPFVIIGSDGWLFSGGWAGAGGFGAVFGPWWDWDEDRGTVQTDPKVLETWRATIIQRASWMSERGTHFLFAIAPIKETIYPEFLPSWLQRSGQQTRLKQFTDAMNDSGVDVLDLAPALLQAKQIGQNLYYKGDTHWNNLGALYAAVAIVNHLHQEVPSVPGASVSNYTVVPAQVTSSPDLALQLGITMTDTEFDVGPRGGWTTKEETTVKDGLTEQFIYTKDDPALPTLLAYTDSFGYALRRPIAEHFRRAVFVNWWPDRGSVEETFPLGLIEQERPDVFLDLRFERGILGPISTWPDTVLSDMNNQPAKPGEPAIQVNTATFGGCGSPQGNLTEQLAKMCNGKLKCQMPINVREITDPAPGCGKTVVADYVCTGEKGGSKTTGLPTGNGLLTLSCAE